jgi:hypothetical protein
VNRFEKSTTARQIRLERRLPSYWRVTFDHPPLNIFGPETIPQLNEIIVALETDEHVKVVVFDSAVEGFFLTHYNFLAPLEDTTSLPPGPTGLQALPDMLVRLSRAPVVSIVSIRGRATGACVGQRHAFCEQREGYSVAVGGWCRPGAWRRTDGSVAPPDRQRPCARSAARR